ncbi:hypothetical protein E2C01_097395 [Portunus trituberculatus]|uniref:Uncharacterized protein n=1 Tax=Portunus trituberculatus TaxID=210409 RepID=A0A5B7K4C9_PORTR|nr:hypothetical protein [Portunus trituberculatus]
MEGWDERWRENWLASRLAELLAERLSGWLVGWLSGWPVSHHQLKANPPLFTTIDCGPGNEHQESGPKGESSYCSRITHLEGH